MSCGIKYSRTTVSTEKVDSLSFAKMMDFRMTKIYTMSVGEISFLLKHGAQKFAFI